MSEEPISLTPTQIDTYLARPEDFPIRKYDDPLDEPFHGQAANDAESQKRADAQ